ncbi:MAG: hypothetical protein ABSD02_09375 [Steroidobacteraceae bacterium]|jgi:hypothetical protein
MSRDIPPGEPIAPLLTREDARVALERALELSRQVLQATENGEAEHVIRLDAERLRLIKSARQALIPMTDEDRAVFRQITELNAQSLGRMEHRFRAKCRDMDMLAAGRRAVRAYSNHRP